MIGFRVAACVTVGFGLLRALIYAMAIISPPKYILSSVLLVSVGIFAIVLSYIPQESFHCLASILLLGITLFTFGDTYAYFERIFDLTDALKLIYYSDAVVATILAVSFMVLAIMAAQASIKRDTTIDEELARLRKGRKS